MKRLASRRPNRTRGFTLTEVVIALAVVSFVSAGVWTAAASVIQKSRIDNALNQMHTVIQNIQDMYGSTHQFSSTNANLTAMMVSAGVFPVDMLDGTTPRTKWGTDVMLRSGPSRTQVVYRWQGPLPVEACKAMAGRLGGTGRDEQLVEITAGSMTYNTKELLDALTPISAPDDCTSLSVTYSLKASLPIFMVPS